MNKQELLNSFSKEEILGLYLKEVYNLYLNEGFTPARSISPGDALEFYNSVNIGEPVFDWNIAENCVNFQILKHR